MLNANVTLVTHKIKKSLDFLCNFNFITKNLKRNQVIATRYTHSFYFISAPIFFLFCIINILGQMKKFFVTDESIIPVYNTIHRPLWWIDKSEWIHFLFPSIFLRRKLDLISFLRFVTTWFSLDTSDETIFWTTSVFSMICWE